MAERELAEGGNGESGANTFFKRSGQTIMGAMLLVIFLGGAYSVVLGVAQLRPTWIGLGLLFMAPYASYKVKTGSDILEGYRNAQKEGAE